MLNANGGSDSERARNGGGGGNGQICFPPAVSNQYLAPQLAMAISVRLAGVPADGSNAPGTVPSGPVIWVDKGNEVLVHLESTQILIQNENVLVLVDLETDSDGQTDAGGCLLAGHGGGRRRPCRGDR
jgi:hypothetical protein